MTNKKDQTLLEEILHELTSINGLKAFDCKADGTHEGAHYIQVDKEDLIQLDYNILMEKINKAILNEENTHPRLEHITQLTRHATKIIIQTPTELLLPKRHVIGPFEKPIDKKIKALKYLENDEYIELILTEEGEDTIITIKIKET